MVSSRVEDRVKLGLSIFGGPAGRIGAALVIVHASVLRPRRFGV